MARRTLTILKFGRSMCITGCVGGGSFGLFRRTHQPAPCALRAKLPRPGRWAAPRPTWTLAWRSTLPHPKNLSPWHRGAWKTAPEACCRGFRGSTERFFSIAFVGTLQKLALCECVPVRPAGGCGRGRCFCFSFFCTVLGPKVAEMEQNGVRSFDTWRDVYSV